MTKIIVPATRLLLTVACVCGAVGVASQAAADNWTLSGTIVDPRFVPAYYAENAGGPGWMGNGPINVSVQLAGTSTATWQNGVVSGSGSIAYTANVTNNPYGLVFPDVPPPSANYAFSFSRDSSTGLLECSVQGIDDAQPYTSNQLDALITRTPIGGALLAGYDTTSGVVLRSLYGTAGSIPAIGGFGLNPPAGGGGGSPPPAGTWPPFVPNGGSLVPAYNAAPVPSATSLSLALNYTDNGQSYYASSPVLTPDHLNHTANFNLSWPANPGGGGGGSPPVLQNSYTNTLTASQALTALMPTVSLDYAATTDASFLSNNQLCMVYSVFDVNHLNNTCPAPGGDTLWTGAGGTGGVSEVGCQTYSQGSVISNLDGAYLHGSFDYKPQATVSSCSSCGGGSAKSPVVPVTLARILRPKDLTQPGSLGLGGFISYDTSATLTQVTTNGVTGLQITLFDPMQITTTTLVDGLDGEGAQDGVFHDVAQQSVTQASMRDANGNLTALFANAAFFKD